MSDAPLFSPQQIEQLRQLFREELGNAGLRIDEADHIDDARRDFQFLRSLRMGASGAASKIGWLVIAALVGAVIWLVNTGLNDWRMH